MIEIRRSFSGHQSIQHLAQVRGRQLDLGMFVFAGTRLREQDRTAVDPDVRLAPLPLASESNAAPGRSSSGS